MMKELCSVCSGKKPKCYTHPFCQLKNCNRLAAMLTTMIEDGQSVMCVMKKITWYIFIICYNIKSLMVVPFMNLLKSTLSPIPCKCPVSEYCQILHFPLPSIEGCREL